MMYITSVLVVLFIIEFVIFSSIILKERQKRSMVEKAAIDIEFKKKSSEVRLGQIVEQIAPFTSKFLYDPKNAKFIGMPIDYIVFGDNEIVFVEVKSGKSSLTKRQLNIKKLIENNAVRFEVLRIE